MYTTEEKAQIERIITVFQDYLQDTKNEHGNPKYNLLWLDNLQCYLMVLNFNETAIIEEDNLMAFPIASAESLYWELIDDMIQSCYVAQGLRGISPSQMTEAQTAQLQDELIRRLTPYLEAMPEYRYLTEDYEKDEKQMRALLEANEEELRNMALQKWDKNLASDDNVF